MTQTKHTPGEWEIGKIAEIFPYCIMSKGRSICFFTDTDTTMDERTANAKLIAATPDMLKELLLIHKDKPRHPNHPNSKFTNKTDYDRAYKKWKRIDNVIKKATE